MRYEFKLHPAAFVLLARAIVAERDAKRKRQYRAKPQRAKVLRKA